MAMLLGGASLAKAGTFHCSDFGGVIDGFNPTTFNYISTTNNTLGIDESCTIKNWPKNNGIGGFPITNINFYFPGGADYYIIFQNVYYPGNMSCNDPTNSNFWIYWAPGAFNSISSNCQTFLVPVDVVEKTNPPAQTTATVGIPFTYTITQPKLGQWNVDTATVTTVSQYDTADVSNEVITDDLTASGAALTYVTNKAYLVDVTTGTRTLLNGGAPLVLGASSTWLSAHPGITSDSTKHLVFSYENNSDLKNVPAGYRIDIELTVVLDNDPANTPGVAFTNTANMWFDKTISYTKSDGTTGYTTVTDLQALPGTTQPMTIVAPDLVVTKASTMTNLNVGTAAPFTIDVANVGGSAAWQATFSDEFPAGMCQHDPTGSVTANLYAADGSLISKLAAGTDYKLSWTGTPTTTTSCQLTLTMLPGSLVSIGPNQHLRLAYQAQLDTGTAPGLTLTNIAAADQWFNDSAENTNRISYSCTPTPYTGTVGITDCQDAYSLTSTTTGYFYLKSVEDLTTGVYPATTAMPGDTLRYTLQLQNFQVPPLTGITITDDLGSLSPGAIVSGITVVSGSNTFPVTASTCASCGTGGAPKITISGFNLPGNTQYSIQFDVKLASGLGDGTTVANQASLTATDSTTNAKISGVSDDPFVGTPGPQQMGTSGDATSVTINSPGALNKQNTQSSATIGQQFTYDITVPAKLVDMPLYDVRILDNLGASAADLSFVSAKVISGGTWAVMNTGNSSSLVLEDVGTGIDIPANSQAVIAVTVRLNNSSTNRSGLAFHNTASYTFDRVNGDTTTQTAGAAATTADMSVVEPALSVNKSVSFVSPAGKTPSDPATVGDVIEYQVTMTNTGSSPAYDTNIVDTLPADLSLVANSATAMLNGVAVSGFVATPTTLSSGALDWGRQNGDGSLDIPVGQTLVLTYQATVVSVSGGTISNSAYVDWTSLNGPSSFERYSNGCPTTDTLNDYCAGPASATLSAVDNTSISKTVLSDTYAESPPSTGNRVLRVGDTATYELTLNLQEYTTKNVVVQDTLPVGMALVSANIIAGSNFSYTMVSQPSAGDTGTLSWQFGDITNTPSGTGTSVNQLVIRYVAKVVSTAPPSGISYNTSVNLTNRASLSYTGGDPSAYPARLTSNATIEVRQPQMSTLTKKVIGGNWNGSGTTADPYRVNVASDVMNFELSSCNNGLAPAYGVVVTDQLAPEFDETSLVTSPPVVKLGGTTLVAGSDYTINTPARGGQLRITLLDSAPVAAGQCLTVDYSLGFHTDLTSQTTWSNSAQLPDYYSLPANGGRLYTQSSSAQIWMTNLVGTGGMLKTLVSSTKATIGDGVVYQIKVPAVPINAAMDNVVVSDNLNAALVYLSANAVDSSGNPISLTDNSVQPGQVSLTIASIPAGGQAIITLHTRVANNSQANAGTSVTNTASYSYTNMPAGLNTSSTSAPFTIVEPKVSLTNSVSPSSPKPGDLLTYTLTFTAAGGSSGGDYSNAYDLTVENSLGLGLLYQKGSATLTTASGSNTQLADPTTNGGDGVSTAESFTWDLAHGTNIDIPQGQTVTIRYQVLVLSSVSPGQSLSNSVRGRWTSLNGDQSAIERTGSGSPAYNDYFTPLATQTVASALAITFNKAVVNDTTGQNPGTDAQPGNTLRYTLTLHNDSIVPADNITVSDDLAAQFLPGTLKIIGVPSGADSSASNASGGSNSTGMVNIQHVNLAAQGQTGDSQTIVFTATLAPVIDNGTVVLNQARASATTLATTKSTKTSTLIHSAPLMKVEKTSQDMTGDPSVLLPGDTLRYTITVNNIGNENAAAVTLRDLIPTYTSYVPGSTHLNGNAVADSSAGVSPLQNGMLIDAPGDTTPGLMRADPSASAGNTATITFEVVVNSGVVSGTVISNQGQLDAQHAGGGSIPETPSDDPNTSVPNDPTVNVVGSVAHIDAQKTVKLVIDKGTPGIVDPNDVLRYTITISNIGPVPATGVKLVDAVPPHTSFVSGSVTLNNSPIADSGTSPLVTGIPVNSPDTTRSGVISAGKSAVVTFDVKVDAAATPGTVISNQGTVNSDAQAPEPTDADGNDANGDQPTVVVVGNAQLLSITKQVFDLNGGNVQPGDELEYEIQVKNIGTVPATDVQITDNLDNPVAGQLNYVAGSATLNGSGKGVSYSAAVITADYGSTYGMLAPGASAVVRLHANVDKSQTTGTVITNTGQVDWNAATQHASASVSVTVGAPPNPNAATLAGTVWHDANDDKSPDGGETLLSGWSVELYRNTTLIGTTQTDAKGTYQFTGIAPNNGNSDRYNVHFLAPGAGSNTAALGMADSPFTNGLQSISQIVLSAGSITTGMNMPIMPDGVVYNTIARTPIAGATLTLLDAGSQQPLPASCFDDAAQQNQVTTVNGYYRFDINFSDPTSCPAGGDYLIRVTPPISGYEQRNVSLIIPPQTDAATGPFSVPACLGTAADAVPSTPNICEAVASASQPPTTVAARTSGTNYYLHLTLGDATVPGDGQLFNNHIPLDPILNSAVAITKTSAKVNVSRGDLVPYTITVNNGYFLTLQNLSIVDTFPPGFKYVKGSSRFDGQPLKPVTNGNQLYWNNVNLSTDSKHTIQLLFIVGAGVSDGDYVNRAQVINTLSADAVSGKAEATVHVVPDPTLDCSDVIGKVFDDKNLNGVQDKGEKGLPGVRLVTVRGLQVTSDAYGRFHITCAAVPDESRGSNFILKLDDRSLPTGFRLTTENPRVERLTRGKMAKFDFGAAISRVVRLDVANGVFEPNSTSMRPQWRPRINLLLDQLKKAPSVLRISYLADVEDEDLVKRRMAALKATITKRWKSLNCCYELSIETEVFWRRGAPPNRSFGK